MQADAQREDSLFQAAAQLTGQARASFLEAVARGEPALRQRLEALLAAHEQTEGALAGAPPPPKATVRVVLPDAPDEAVGQAIGRYKVLQKIGEGGCGAVYMAEQETPVRRRVALKVIKLGMDTKAVIARFEAERQALALMDHPNIAKVLDAGATEAGRPFFVMELVRGIKFTEYCDQNHLDTSTRLELFIQICQAIQHAHQKGIIHRDIKPSNILVTMHDGVPVPKVIDFGIAKATTDQRLTDKTLFTAYEQFIGTPAYMSPEQAEMSGLDIDTRSDIYSLGVLLYELLTGRTPFDPKELMESGLDAMRKTIREKEPVRPSTKLHTLQGEELTTTAKRHGVDVPKLVSQLRGDLDWIVMKCLEKDRTRRYETANGLTMDLKRHLNNEPVLARPPSKLYEFQKTFRRHKFGFAAAGAIMLVLAGGVALTTWQAVRATRAKHLALEAQASEAKQRQLAEAARANEVRLRKQAQAEELAARQRAYASDMNVAKQALDGNNLGRALDLLKRQEPQPGQKDLRGWEWRYLWRQTRSDALFTLCQKSEIESLAVSSDGRWLALGVVHKDGLFLFDLQTRREIAHLAAGEGNVRAAFSPAEPLLAFTSLDIPASGEAQAKLRLWNMSTRLMTAQLPLDSICGGLAFAKDGRTLVTSTARQLILWRIPEATKLAIYAGGQQTSLNPANAFAATSDLGLAAYGATSGQVRLIDLRDGRELWSVVASKSYITALAFSPDGKTLASAAGFGESAIRLWDVATRAESGRLEGHTSWVGSLVFWPDGKKLASCSADQTIRVWDLASRKCLDVLRGHRLEVWRLALLPDNKTLVSGSKDGEVCVWDTSVTHPAQGRVAIPDHVVDWCFAPDSRSVLALNERGQVARWGGVDFQRQEPLTDIGISLGDWAIAQHARCFSPDGRFLAVGSTNGIVSVWGASQPVPRREFKPGGGSVIPQKFLAGDSRLVVWMHNGNRLSEWDLQANREIQSWPAPARYQDCDVSPDERLAVAVGREGDVICRDLQKHTSTNLPLDALEGWTVAFSADGSALVISSALGYARVWNIKTWKEVATLRGFLNAVDQAVFSPDNRRVATSGSRPDDELKLWSGDVRQEVLTLEGAGFEFARTAFSPDASAIGVLSEDGILNLWRAPSWAEIHAAEANDKTEAQPP